MRSQVGTNIWIISVVPSVLEASEGCRCTLSNSNEYFRNSNCTDKQMRDVLHLKMGIYSIEPLIKLYGCKPLFHSGWEPLYLRKVASIMAGGPWLSCPEIAKLAKIFSVFAHKKMTFISISEEASRRISLLNRGRSIMFKSQIGCTVRKWHMSAL